MKENRKRLISAVLAAIITVSSAVTAGAEDIPEDIASGFEAAAGTLSASGVSINAENFPDEAFRKYVSESLDDGDGSLSETEISAVTEINVREKRIHSLKGIEYFTALTKLDCYDNFITGLDMTKNTALTELNCEYNRLSTLDVSKNTALTKLNCSRNIFLESLDVSKNTVLEELNCGEDLITSLDVSNNTGLKILLCGINRFTELDVSKNLLLKELDCSYSGITSLDISNNAELEKLNCSRNQLSALDLSQNTGLKELNCYDNQLTSLDLSSCTGLTYLDCSQNQLADLEIKQCTGLTYLECDDNDITSLDLSGLSELAELNCCNCLIESLDLSGCVSLKDLNCGYNYIETLDLSDCTALESIGCGKDDLTDLDVSGCTGLKELYCFDNQLTALDLSNNTVLETIECNGNKLTSLDVSSCRKLKELDCYDNSIASLDVSRNTELAKLYCFSNPIKSIDISNNTKLKDFFALPGDYTLSSKSLDELKKFGFDPAKASKWTGAEYNSDTNSLENITADKITFNYKVAEYWDETLTIIPPKTPDKPYIPSIPSTPIKPAAPSVPEKTEEVKETVVPEKPSFSAAVENGRAVLSWGKINGAESYNIYRYANGKYILLGSTKKTSFRLGGLKDNKTYKLLVTAVNEKGESEYSKADIITIEGSGKPVNPDVSAVLKNGKAVLSWEKVTGAESYNIYRYKNGKYTLLGTTGKTSFRIGGLKKGKTYKFVVSAVNETGESRYMKASAVSVTRS